MKILHMLPLIIAIVVGAIVTFMSSPVSIVIGAGVFMVSTTIALSLVGGLWFILAYSFFEAEQ